MKRPRVSWRLVLVLVLAGGGIAWWRVDAARGPRVTTHTVARQELVQTVVASGRVAPLAELELGSTVTGRVLEVAVDEGEVVPAGRLLVQLDDDAAKAAVDQARAAALHAEVGSGRVQEVGSRVADAALRDARAALAQAERERTRIRPLVAAGALPRDQLDDAETKVERARTQARSAAAQAAAQAPAGADRRLAEASLDEARAAVAVAEARLAETRLVAPFDATVLRRDVEPGDVVSPGRALLVLARSGRTRLVVEPDEKNLAVLRIGLPALASADAFPDRPFPAHVTRIAPAVDRRRGTVEVELEVPSPPDYLRPDMTASVEIEVARRAGALTLPAETVHEPSGPTPWALVVAGDTAEKRPLSLGIRGDGIVELLGGVAEGERVIVPGKARVEPGDRVRAD